MNRSTTCVLGIAGVASLVPCAVARPDMEFVTIGAPGNAPIPGPQLYGWLPILGTGSVPYEYRIGKYEVTTAQWMEFVNCYSLYSSQWFPHNRWHGFAVPMFWGAIQNPSYNGPGYQYIVNPNEPNAAMRPVYGISWREAAMFCNWLHNGKAPGVWAIMDGAYDVSTFRPLKPSHFLDFKDQLTRHPGARFWIPSFDEWNKAAYYDPNRYGPGQEGWWQYPNRSNHPPVGGLPGIGQTNANFNLPNWGVYKIPLGSYPNTLSPWGALDMSGMATEHTEYWWPFRTPTERATKGAGVGSSTFLYDRIFAPSNWVLPTSTYWSSGLRVAASVPGPRASGPSCAPDCNEDGVLTVADFACFQSAYVWQNPIADCDRDGLYSVFDFGCFQTKFVAGCP